MIQIEVFYDRDNAIAKGCGSDAVMNLHLRQLAGICWSAITASLPIRPSDNSHTQH